MSKPVRFTPVIRVFTLFILSSPARADENAGSFQLHLEIN